VNPAAPPLESRASAAGAVRLIAFYLPRFHPIPENDRWWGKGFTEWHSVEDDAAFIESLFPLFRDERYIRVFDRPLLFVHRTELFPDPRRTSDPWREAALKAGVGDLYLVKVESFLSTGDPQAIGFDASAEFPGHQIPMEVEYHIEHRIQSFEARLFNYPKYADLMMQRPEPGYKRFQGVLPTWDNTPRMAARGSLFVDSSPAKYQEWLGAAVKRTRDRFRGDERIVVINAWNEWGEGCHLEPDQKYGLQYLQATRAALGK